MKVKLPWVIIGASLAVLFGSVAVGQDGNGSPLYPKITRTIRMRPDGTMSWEGQPFLVALYDIIVDLREFHERHPERQAGIVFEPDGTELSNVVWLFNTARRAGITNVWFGPSARAPALSPWRDSIGPLVWVPADRFADVGRKTPMAALETIFWADAHCNDEAFARAADLSDHVVVGAPVGAQMLGTFIWKALPPDGAEILKARHVFRVKAVQFYGVWRHGRLADVGVLGLDPDGSARFLLRHFVVQDGEWYLCSPFDDPDVPPVVD
jgi:hypothetical protein